MPKGGSETKGIIMVHVVQSLDTDIARVYSPLVNRTWKCSYVIYVQTNKYTGKEKSHR